MTRTVSAGNGGRWLSSWITGFIGFPASLRRVLKWVGEPDNLVCASTEKCFLHLLLKTICLMSVFKGRICPNKVVCPKNVWRRGIYPDKGVNSPMEPSHASTTCPPSRIWSDFGQESVAGRLVIFVVNLGLVIPTQPFELSGDFRIITAVFILILKPM